MSLMKPLCVQEKLRKLSKDREIIESESWHHFHFCDFCLPTNWGMSDEQKYCPEGLSYVKRMREGSNFIVK